MRGVAQSTLIKLILLILAIAFLFPFIALFLVFATNYAEGGICQASAAISSYKVEKLCVDVVESPISLSCPRKHITINKESATLIEDSKKSVLIEYKELNPEILNYLFADQLYSAWKNFGKGSTIIFSEMDEDNLGDYSTACFVYSEIHFDNVNTITSNLGSYLETEIPKDEELTYKALFNNPKVICEEPYKKGGCWNNLEKYFLTATKEYMDEDGNIEDCEEKTCRGVTPLNQISTDKDYAVVVLRKRFDWCEDNDDYDLSLITYVMPIEDLNKACDRFIT